MKRKTKTQKGITLVALIITIIVLLILAVVAIRAVQGDGIIAHAKNARDSYNQAQIEENDILSSYLSQIESNIPAKTEPAWYILTDEEKKELKDHKIDNSDVYIVYENSETKYRCMCIADGLISFGGESENVPDYTSYIFVGKDCDLSVLLRRCRGSKERKWRKY